MAIVEGSIEETVSWVALQRLLAAYADAVNRRAWGELPELFLPDATIELTPTHREPLTISGPEELGRFIDGAIERFEFFEFVFLNSRIELDLAADRARGRNFMCELRQEKYSGRFNRVFGVYHDEYRRIDGRWWFERRAFDPLAATDRDNLVFERPKGFDALLAGSD